MSDLGDAQKRNHTVDLTSGSMFVQIITFVIPVILGHLLQTLYSSVDALVVGNLINKDALAAISVSDPIANMIVGFFTGMSVGATVVVSRQFGKNKQEGLGKIVTAVFTFAVLLGAVLSVVCVIASDWLLLLVSAPAETYREASVYLRIYLAGNMFTVIYNICAGMLRAVGNSRSPFRILLITSTLNIVLDLAFITVLPLGIAGVALATVFSQGISVVLAFMELRKLSNAVGFSPRSMKENRAVIKDVLSIGLPTGIQSSLVSMAKVFLMRYVSDYGAAALAGVGVAHRLDKFVSINCESFGTAVTTFVSQNIGAGNRQRVKKSIQLCLLLSVAVTAAVGVIVYILAPQCVMLFNKEAEVVQVGVAMMRVLIPFYFLIAVRQIQQGVLRSYHKVKVPMVISVIGLLAVRHLYLLIMMNRNPAIEHIFYSYPISWAATVILTYVYIAYLLYRRGKKQNGSEQASNNLSTVSGNQSGNG